MYLSPNADQKLVNAYYDLMVELAVLLGANRTQAEIELLEQLEFEKKLANVGSDSK